MAQHSKVPYRNRNHTGWWIYAEVEYWVSTRQKKLLPGSRCLVWENTRLIRANDRNDAYRKALKRSNAGYPSKTRGGEWRFAGISMLLPVYDDLADGVELLWDDRGFLPMKKIKSLVKSKARLPVFDDRDWDKTVRR